MVRKEIYLVDDKEVTKDEWEIKFKDENNLSTLTIKYEKIKDVDYLIKVIEELKKELKEEKSKKNTIVDWNEIFRDKNKYPYPYITYPSTIKPDWTLRPEQTPLYFTTTDNKTN